VSDQTRTALDDAIRAHIAAQEPDEYVTDWVVLAATALPETGDAHGYARIARDGQAIHTTLGLIEEARHSYQANATASLIEEDQ